MTNQITLTQSTNGFTRNHGLPDLINILRDLEALENPDHVVQINKLGADENLNIVVPGIGRYQMTDWSKSQIATLLGIKFDKWFENATQDEKEFELNRRLARATGEVKLRTSLIDAGTNGNDGTLKAIVSPGFTPVKDSEVAQMIFNSMNSIEPDSGIISAHVTTRSVSYSIRIGKAFCPGESAVGDLFGCLHILNSSVGFSSLAISAKIVRLICTNGMRAPIADSMLLHKRHTSGLSIESIGKAIGDKLIALPGKLRQAGQILQSARNIIVDNVEETITRFLQQAHLPRKLVQPIMVAYQREPHASAFGLSQALTDSQTLSELGMKPEERHQLETAAGEFLRSITNQ